MLTAGHCVTTPGPKRQFMYHDGLPALVEVNASGSFTDPNAPADSRYFENMAPIWDWALLPFQVTGNTQWHQRWFTNRSKHNLVLSSCVAGHSPQPCTSGSYSISGYIEWANILQGTVVCATGTGRADIYSDNVGYTPGTRCGQIVDKHMIDYSNPDNTYGKALKVNICTREGDSGSPLWDQSNGIAYGILSGGGAGVGACNPSSPNEYGVYSPLSYIIPHASFNTGTTMSLITTAGG